MRLKFPVALPLASLALGLAGCDANQLSNGSKTVIGVNAAVNLDPVRGLLVVGYDSSVTTNVPRRIDDVGDKEKKDAMSVVACSAFDVAGMKIKHFRESIAAGKAAEDLASRLGNDPALVKQFLDCSERKPRPIPPAPAPSTASPAERTHR